MEIKTQTKRNKTDFNENIKNINLFLRDLEIEVKESEWGEKELKEIEIKFLDGIYFLLRWRR